MRGNYEAKDSNSLCCNESLKNRALSKTAHNTRNAKFRISRGANCEMLGYGKEGLALQRDSRWR